MKSLRKAVAKRLGSALIMTLVIVVLITVVVVGYLASVMLESKTAGSSLDQERAYGIAMIGVHEAMSRVRDALGPWDDPLKNFAVGSPDFYWSLSPGRITRWSYASPSPQANFALFSESDGTGLVNLNRPLADGSRPIIGGPNPPDLSVTWENVLSDPSKAVGQNNAIIGRYAFWVDDEGAKINVNTADGTEKYTTSSLGIGSPSEVSLEVLFSGGNAKDLSKEIVGVARTEGFSSPREILRSAKVPADAYTDNVFALTAYSRSPELNIFGQPRMAILPVLGDAAQNATDMAINGITLEPVREIYPSPSQLPRFALTNPRKGYVANVSWPLAFRQDYALMTPGRGMDIDQDWIYTWDNYCYVNGMLLAKYLWGLNGADRQISWPVLPGSSDKGFKGKYSARQIDSIAAQICNLGSRAISPDYAFVSGSTSWFSETKSERSSAPVLFPGFTSGQWVTGMGRSPKVSRLLLQFSTYASSGVWGDANNPYVPPKVSLGAWVEWWLPAAFQGGNTLVAGTGGQITVGHGYNNSLNCVDGLPSYEQSPTSAHPKIPAVLPRADGSLTSFWSDQLLTNDQGVDWRGNPPDREDPEGFIRAEQYHSPYAYDSTNNIYLGTGPLPGKLPVSPFQMADLKSPNSEWYPGQIRAVGNTYSSIRLPMQTKATTLAISGGIAVRAQMRYGQFSDPDPTPLEAVRGIYRKPDGTYSSLSMWTWEEYMSSANTPQKPGETVRDRVMKSVIPVNVVIPVPSNVGGSETRYVLADVADPLVNKFPGDWNSREIGGLIPFMQLGPPGSTIFFGYNETVSWRSFLTDPDSYWMPRIDSLYFADSAAARTPVIPRSARFPSLGYLQYVRTGIIPDDELVDYSLQKGTPFRLLSFAPSTEVNRSNPLAGQQTTSGLSEPYPDWAMLDLLYVPSTLSPYGGPYGDAPNLLYFGTYGGATAGRINPNGSVLYTTDVNSPLPGVSRTLPLRALLTGLKCNQTISGVGPDVRLVGGINVDAEDLSQAIEEYVRRNGPLHIPGQICNVPKIADIRPAFNKTRNDLVRQIVGNLTTQGNVFSVWAIGQTLLKNGKNNGYDKFESGDTVLAEVRLHFIVERYLDPGADGIYGNSGNSGTDGVVGTYDDPVDSVAHPFEPRYLYRVVASEEIR